MPTPAPSAQLPGAAPPAYVIARTAAGALTGWWLDLEDGPTLAVVEDGPDEHTTVRLEGRPISVAVAPRGDLLARMRLLLRVAVEVLR